MLTTMNQLAANIPNAPNLPLTSAMMIGSLITLLDSSRRFYLERWPYYMAYIHVFLLNRSNLN
jgi:hypothetical protein